MKQAQTQTQAHTDRQTDRQTQTQTQTQAHTQTQTQTQAHTHRDRQTDRQTDTHTHTDLDTHTHTHWQIVRYGLDTSVSVTSAVGKTDQTISKIELSTAKHGLRQTDAVNGITITYRCQRETTYTLKNNSADGTTKLVYVDHTASNAHGGYSVTTTENCIKSSTGFSRFCFELSPQEEVVFKVQEEAMHKRDVKSGFTEYTDSANTSVYKSRGLLTETMIDRLKQLRALDRIKGALDVSAATQVTTATPKDKIDKELDEVVASVPESLKDVARKCFSGKTTDSKRRRRRGRRRRRRRRRRRKRRRRSALVCVNACVHTFMHVCVRVRALFPFPLPTNLLVSLSTSTTNIAFRRSAPGPAQVDGNVPANCIKGTAAHKPAHGHFAD